MLLIINDIINDTIIYIYNNNIIILIYIYT